MARYIKKIPLFVLGVLVTGILSAGLHYAFAKPLVVDLSDRIVRIEADFTGTDLLLFGTTPGVGDVVVVVRGPVSDQVVRKKDRVFGVWVNTEEITFESAPNYYAVASNKPIDEFASGLTRTDHQIGIDYLVLEPSPEAIKNEQLAPGQIRDFRKALIRQKIKRGLYDDEVGHVTFVSDQLWRMDLKLPANIITGTYGVDAYLFDDGEVAAIETTLIQVRKFGFEATTYDLAHREPLAYGLTAILIAVFAGWLAAVAFRKT